MPRWSCRDPRRCSWGPGDTIRSLEGTGARCRGDREISEKQESAPPPTSQKLQAVLSWRTRLGFLWSLQLEGSPS